METAACWQHRVDLGEGDRSQPTSSTFPPKRCSPMAKVGSYANELARTCCAPSMFLLGTWHVSSWINVCTVASPAGNTTTMVLAALQPVHERLFDRLVRAWRRVSPTVLNQLRTMVVVPRV